MYSIELADTWNGYFDRLSPDMRKRVWKKIQQIKAGLPGRHLRFGVDFFVEEVGQYRICYKSFEARKVRRFYFVGDHKEYERWARMK
jgi:hypothetical protein